MLQKKYLWKSSPEASAESVFMNSMIDAPATSGTTGEHHVFSLHNMLLRKFKADWIEWLPETLWKLLDDPAMDRVTKDKILALQLALKTNRPWVEYETFEKVATAFNGDVPNHWVLEPRSPAECLITMSMLHTIRPDEQFSEEVSAYVAACFAHDGFLNVGPMPIAQEAQRFLSLLNFSHAGIPLETAAHIGTLFAGLWGKHKGTLDEVMLTAEDNVTKVQMRKLYGIYAQLENHNGIKH